MRLSDLLRSPSPLNPFGWFPQFLEFGRRRIRSQVRVLGLALLVGIVAGLGGILFHLSTRVAEHYALGMLVGYTAEPHPAGEAELGWLPEIQTPFRPWLLLIVPTVGGLVSGYLVFHFAPEAEGHGTDAAIAAYHQRQGYIRPRVPLIKILASSITLGTGGSGGREGPIAQIGAGFGSFLSNLLRLRPAERRVLMAAGMGAGIAAVFRAPLAGAMFAAEVMYSSPEFEPEVIIPTGISSVVSYCVFGLYSGWQPLFSIPPLTFHDPLQLGPYLLLALFMALLAMLYTRSFYGTVRLFHALPIPRTFKPAIGAFLTGVLALVLYFSFGQNKQVLSVLAFGYNSIQGAINNETTSSAVILMAIALGKILTTSLTIGSGGSGGVFGPSMVIGGCGGGALGLVMNQWWPQLVPHPASFVIVGMGGFFAAAAKTPFSTLIIVSEMTGGYTLLLPALWVCLIAFVVSDAQSIYSSQIEGHALSPAHQGAFVRQILGAVRVSQFLKPSTDVPVLSAGDSLATVVHRLGATAQPVLPVVDGDQRLLGVVNLEEVHLASQIGLPPLILVEDLMRTDVRPLLPHNTLDRALELFIENDLLSLPVVDDLEHRRVIGLLRRYEIASAYLRHIHGPTVQT